MTADDRRDALLSQVAARYYRDHETQEEIASGNWPVGSDGFQAPVQG